MEWFQLGQVSWMGLASSGWLWVDRPTAALIAGALLGSGTGPWVVLDQFGFPVVPQMPTIPTIPTIPMAAEPIMSPWYKSAA